jgi:phosphopantetheinyl transferase
MKGKCYFAQQALKDCTGHEAGRQLLQQLYTRHVGGVMPQVQRQAGGKPVFADSPWHFSISHTRHHAFCVLADHPVGLDAEEADRQIDLRLAASVLSPGEKAQFDAAEDPRKTLLTFCVLKEAAGKLSGEGVGFHPRHTEFVLPDARVWEVDGCIVALMEETLETGGKCDVI